MKEGNIYDKLIQKAKLKADGVYSFDGVIYRVKHGTLIHYAHSGDILAAYGHFVTVAGKYKTAAEAKKMLKNFKEENF